jgi:hypothetical protein
MKRGNVPRRNQAFGQLRMQAGPEVMQQHKAAVEDPRWYNYIGVYSPVGQFKFSRLDSPPAFRLPARILVANQQHGLNLFKKYL